MASRSFSVELPASLVRPFPSSLRGPVPSTFAGTLVSISVSVFSGFYMRMISYSDHGLHEGVDWNLPDPLGPVMNKCSRLSGISRTFEGLLWLRGSRLQAEMLEKQSCSFYIRLSFDLVAVGVQAQRQRAMASPYSWTQLEIHI